MDLPSADIAAQAPNMDTALGLVGTPFQNPDPVDFEVGIFENIQAKLTDYSFGVPKGKEYNLLPMVLASDRETQLLFFGEASVFAFKFTGPKQFTDPWPVGSYPDNYVLPGFGLNRDASTVKKWVPANGLSFQLSVFNHDV